jgi:hypothetical protein
MHQQVAHEGLAPSVLGTALPVQQRAQQATAITYVTQLVIPCLQLRVQVVLQGVRALGSHHADERKRSPAVPNLHINTLLAVIIHSRLASTKTCQGRLLAGFGAMGPSLSILGLLAQSCHRSTPTCAFVG